MKIISPFKDYYDWIAGKYGGGDPRMVYTRNCIKGREINDRVYSSIVAGNFRGISILNTNRVRAGQQPYSFKILIFCGRAFLVVNDEHGAAILSENRHPDLHYVLNTLMPARVRSPITSELVLNEPSKHAAKLCKEFMQPVLMIGANLGVAVEDRIPILQNVGFASVMPAEQCYQEIAHYITNVLRDNPDIRQPVEVDDKYKIVAAGFDTKTSFRHRK